MCIRDRFRPTSWRWKAKNSMKPMMNMTEVSFTFIMKLLPCLLYTSSNLRIYCKLKNLFYICYIDHLIISTDVYKRQGYGAVHGLDLAGALGVTGVHDQDIRPRHAVAHEAADDGAGRCV